MYRCRQPLLFDNTCTLAFLAAESSLSPPVTDAIDLHPPLGTSSRMAREIKSTSTTTEVDEGEEEVAEHFCYNNSHYCATPMAAVSRIPEAAACPPPPGRRRHYKMRMPKAGRASAAAGATAMEPAGCFFPVPPNLEAVFVPLSPAAHHHHHLSRTNETPRSAR